MPVRTNVILLLLLMGFAVKGLGQPQAGFSIFGVPGNSSVAAGPSVLKICQGTKITLHNTSFENGGVINVVRYAYKKGSPASLPTLVRFFPDQQVTFNSLGVDTIWQFVTDALKRTTSIFQPILVNSVYPDSVFSFSPNPPAVACGSSLFTFTARNQFNDSSAVFTWSFQGSSTNTAQGSSVSIQFDNATGNGNGSYQAKLFAVSEFGCAASSAQTIPVNQIPDVSIISPNAGRPPAAIQSIFPKNIFTLCQAGDSVVQFVNNSSTENTNSYYHIEWGNGAKNYDSSSWSTSNTISQAFPLGYDTVTISITGGNTCVNSAKYIIYRGALPAKDVFVNNPNTLCIGDSVSVKFGAGIQKGPPATSYRMIIFENPVVDTTLSQNDLNQKGYTFTHVFNQPSCSVRDTISPAVNNAYNIYFSAINACGPVNSQPAAIRVSATPSVLINAPTTVCNNSTVALSNNTNWAGVYPYCGQQPTNIGKVWTILPPPGGKYTIVKNVLGTLNPYFSGDDSISATFSGVGVYKARLYVKSTSDSAANCTKGDSSNFSDTYICVRNAPEPDFELSNQSICAKNVVYVTNNIDTALKCGQDVYHWSATLLDSSLGCSIKGMPVFSDSLGKLPTISFPAPGLYKITLTVSPAGTGINGCTKSVSHTIQVFKKPGIKFRPWAVPSICPGDSLRIAQYVQIDSCSVPGPLQYQWWASNLPDTSFDSADPGFITYSKPGTWYLNLTLSTDKSCGDTSTYTSILVTNPGSLPPIPDMAVCSGFPIAIKPSSADSLATYFWTSKPVNTGTIIGNTNDTGATGKKLITDTLINVTVPSAPAVVQYYIYTKGGVCKSNLDTLNVTVLPTDSANAGADQFVCKGADFCYLNAVPPSYKLATGSWTQESGPLAVIADDKNPNTKISGLVSGNVYSFKWTVHNPGAACADSTDIVKVYLDTIVNFIDQPPLLCQGDSTFIYGHSTAGVDTINYSYRWLQSNDSVHYFPETSATYNKRNLHILPQPNTFYRRVVNFHGCADTSNTVAMHFLPKLNQPTFSQTAASGCGPLPELFSNNTQPPPQGQFSYQWLIGNNIISKNVDTVNQVFAGTAAGFGDTSYTVILRATNGCVYLSDTSVITVRGVPKAAVDADITNGCSPLKVTFVNNSIGSIDVNTVNFGRGAPSQTINSQKFSHIFNVSSLVNFAVRLKASNQCGSSSDSVIVAVNANTINLHFGVATPLNNGCSGTPILFKNTTTGANVFKWSFGDGSSIFTAESAATVSHVYQFPGTDTVQLCAANGCTLDTCTTMLVNIKKSPKAIFSISPNALCTGSSVSTINQSTPANDPLAFSWLFGDGTGFYHDKEPTHTYYLPGNDTVWLFVSELFDQGFSCKDSTYKIVTVSGPSGVLSYDSTTCTGNTVAFRLAGANANNYKFDFGDYTPLVATSNPYATHSYITPGTYLPKVILTEGTCRSVVSGIDSLLADRVVAAFKYQSTLFCDSTQIVLTDSSYDYLGKLTTQWSFNGNNYFGATASGTLMQSNNYPASLTVKGPTGCTSQITQMINILVHESATGGISVTSDSCAKDIVEFNAAMFSNDPVQFTWNFGNGAIKAGQYASTIFAQPGFYTVNVSALTDFGCSTNTNYVVAIKNKPILKVIPGSEVWICEGNTAQLKAYSPYVVSWSWGPTNGLSCFDCATTLASPQNSTLYTITGINDEGCATTDTVIVTVQKPFNTSVTPTNVSFCDGGATMQPIQFFASGANNYTWNPSTWLNSNTIYNPVLTIPQGSVKNSEQFTYQIIGYDSHHCFADTASVVVSVGAVPIVHLGVGDDGVAGRVVTLTPSVATGGPFKSFTWKVLHGNGTAVCLNSICDSVQLTINSSVTFQVTAINNFGCFSTDTIHYNAFCSENDEQVYVPNAFSPDGDGINDIFMVQGKGITVESFKVFSRWGQLVYDGGSNFAPGTTSHGWDGTFNGKKVTEDVYVFIAKVKCTAGNNSYFKKGSVTLMRVNK